MGWWWSSKPASPDGQLPPSSPSTVHDEAPSPPTNTPPIADPVKRTLSREEQSNQELIELLKELQGQMDSEQVQKPKEAGILAHSIPAPSDISPDSLYPTDMSCRSALDYAMFCQSFGGQFVNIYRYGQFRSCSNHWEDFWLCMRTRNWDKKDREQAVQEHYRKKAVKWKTGPSSEDIWEVRQEPVKDAFQGNLEELEARIAEWQKANPGAPDPWKQEKAPTFNTANVVR
ncbi:hypothetical protein A1O3_00343 [Capronia epimyces CBS 606.96]|uniref:Early meiotic induction protein 1 n=1 Tax=Capronia epimyces CBS 606.96 TaxID=1182542 RepID=W9YGW4_9EURO|nr:uncharacterized protein A1O3_00343 [Capronia epimyces CBS 606.96]EXJ91793.1 hypothetical protein A1O3_00343 [Capronia epimyces CBS 606.96]